MHDSQRHLCEEAGEEPADCCEGAEEGASESWAEDWAAAEVRGEFESASRGICTTPGDEWCRRD